MTDLAENPVRKVLIVAPNWLGDAVMMTPLLEFLQNPLNFHNDEKLHISLAIRNNWAPLFESDPRVDELILLDRNGRHGGIKGLFIQAHEMGKHRFNFALLCPPSFRVGAASWLARIPHRIGYAADGRTPLLTTSIKRAPRGVMHYSQEMVGLGKAMPNAFNDSPSPVLTQLPGCNDIIPADFSDGPPVWVMAPGTTYGEAKTWPAQQVSTFLDLAIKKIGVRVLLLGDNQTKDFVGQLKESCSSHWRTQLKGPPAIVDFTGKTKLMEVVALLKSSDAFVGNDSGLMHLAGALGVPTVGLFGSSNPDWTAPIGHRTKALAVPGFPCRPCYRKTCNHTEFCLDKLTADEVFTALNSLLQESN